MEDFIKSIYSFLFALLALVGMVFLPVQTYENLKKSLDYLEQNTTTTHAFGSWLVQKYLVGAILIVVTIVLSKAAKQAYDDKYGDEKE